MKRTTKIRLKIINAIRNIPNEDKNLFKFISSLKLSPEQKILDVGCGYGRNLGLLRSKGYQVVGIDVNPNVIKTNLKAGFNCMTVQEFKDTNDLYDALLMSHIIEHFQPNDLIEFMDTCLDRLKPSGHLIITTPLNSPSFYEDFDHVKPYHPAGINMVFCDRSSQVQYYSRNKLKLIDIWFRKDPYILIFSPGLYVRQYSRIPLIINLGLKLLFRLSFGFIGITNGWMGLYKKES